MSVNSRFVSACAEGAVPVFNSLITLADLNSVETGVTPLIAAISGNRVEIVRRLLNHPAINVNKADKDSWTALHHACFQNRAEVVDIIGSARGVNINLKEEVTGKTPLMVAVIGESLDVLTRMVKMDGVGLLLADNNMDTAEEIARYKLQIIPFRCQPL